MADYYNWLIESLAEWFMQLFFDPAYHFEAPQKEEQRIVKLQKVVECVKAINKIAGKVVTKIWRKTNHAVKQTVQELSLPGINFLFRHYRLQVALNQWIF